MHHTIDVENEPQSVLAHQRFETIDCESEVALSMTVMEVDD